MAKQELPLINSEQSSTLTETRKSTLIYKYNIPIHYLDFDYIKTCTNGREIEKIYHILLSGEEGHFPALLKTAEERLKDLVPKSKFLRKSTPVLTRQTIEKEEWNSLTDDIGAWVKNISKHDKELSALKSVPTMTETSIRQPVKVDTELIEPKKSNPNRIKSTDYALWDKYDPDTEILKQDLEDKRIKEKARNINKSSLNTKPKKSVKIQEPVATAEAVFEANNEKNIGNEFFKAGEYADALDHYSRSIILNSTAAAYNNRAMTYIKMQKYSNAISDCNEALNREPTNVKALLRKAQSLEALDFYEDALKNVEKAIMVEPNNCLAQNMANNIRQKCTRKFEKSRMLIHDIEESIKESEKEKGRKADNEQKKLRESKTVAVSGKYYKPTSKEPFRNYDRSTNGIETVVLPIPGTSKSAPPFYKVVRRNSVDDEMKRINNRPRILHIPTIYQENTDEEDVEDNQSPRAAKPHFEPTELPFSVVDHCKLKGHEGNYDTTRQGIRITELSEEYNAMPPLESEIKDKNNNNGCCKDKISFTEVLQEVKNLKTYSIVSKQKLDESEFSTTSSSSSSIRHSPRHTSRTDIASEDFQEKPKKRFIEDYCCTSSTYAATSNVISRTSQDRERRDPMGGGDTVDGAQRETEVPEVVESAYTFVSAWNTVCKDITFIKQAELLENLDPARLSDVIGCKLDGEMLSGMIRCMARHFTVPDKLDKVAEILENLAQVPRFSIVLMFLSRDDTVALQNLIDFLEQHGRPLSEELKNDLRGC